MHRSVCCGWTIRRILSHCVNAQKRKVAHHHHHLYHPLTAKKSVFRVMVLKLHRRGDHLSLKVFAFDSNISELYCRSDERKWNELCEELCRICCGFHKEQEALHGLKKNTNNICFWCFRLSTKAVNTCGEHKFFFKQFSLQPNLKEKF